MKLLATSTDGEFKIELFKAPTGGFEIKYGTHSKHLADDLEACEEFGRCLRHSLESAGKLDP